MSVANFFSMLHDETTGEVAMVLCTMSHSSWADDIRLVANNEDVTIGGDTYLSVGLQLSFPDDALGREPEMHWQLHDVDMVVSESILTADGVIDVSISLVLASDTSDTIVGPYEAELRSASMKYGVVSGTLIPYPVLRESWNTATTFSRGDFPALS